MFKKHEVDVLVVGAGPVGMCAALHLAAKGLRVRLIDQAERTNQESYALALHPSVLQMFEELDMTDMLIEHGRRVQKIVLYDGEEAVAESDLSPLESSHPCTLVIPQGQFEEVLMTALKKHGVKVEWGSELTAFQEEEEGVRARIARLKTIAQGYAVSGTRRVESSTEEMTSRFLIGADGAHSTVRRLMELELHHFGSRRSYAVFEFIQPRPVPAEFRLIIHEKGNCGLWPMGGRRARWTFEIDPERSALPVTGDLRALVRERASWFSTEELELRWAGRVNFACWHVDPFARGRVWLAGDAAHQTTPFGVQSMNGGLLEAAYLGSLLSELPQRQNPADALQQYHDSRSEYWSWLLNPERHAEDFAADDPFIEKHSEDIIAALPASGVLLPDVYNLLRPIGAAP